MKDLAEKERLVHAILTVRGETLAADPDEALEQEVKIAAPTLRVFATCRVFLERARYFAQCTSFPLMEEALHQCMESLEDQYALGGWFYENGLSYRLGENAIEATAAQLNAALDRAISEARDEYGPLGLEELERQLPEAAQAIALFAQMYGEDAPAHR